MNCPRGCKTKQEIISAITEGVEECNGCNNWSYKNGIMECEELSKGDTEE